jgi:peptidyl-prolyl cis-trans isomerase D
MSIIQSLRDRAAVLLTALIAISLIGFLVQDAFVGRSKGLFSGRSSSVGSINGKNIDLLEFNDKVNLLEQSYRSRGMQSNEMLTQNVVDGVWNNYVQEELIRSSADQLGLGLTAKEMGSLLFSDDAPQEFKQLFTDQKTGQFDVNAAKTWFNNLKKSKKAEDLKSVNEQLMNPLVNKLLLDKYNSIFVQGSYVPKWMTDKLNADNDGIASISYVSIPYATVSDSINNVKISDAEINEYVASHKEDFKQEKARSIAYVVFDANPSAADSAKVYSDLTGLKEQFRTTTDTKAMVTRNNSKVPYFDGYVLKSRLQMAVKDTIAALPIGTVYGPYLDGGNYVIARKLETRTLPDSMKVRHILIGTVDPQTGAALRPDSVAKKLADSLFAVLKTGGDFRTLAASFSEDEGSKANGGEYNLSSVQMAAMVKEFADFGTYRKPGDRDVIKTSFGYHVMEVISQKDFQESYKVAYIAKPIVSSPETDNAASAAATQFAGNSRNLKSFEENVTKMKLNKRLADNIREMDYSVAGMPSRQLVKWIYDNNVGSVSEPFDLKDKYIVVAVQNSYEEGVQPASVARTMVEPILRNRKKAAEIVKKSGSAATLEAIATSQGQQAAVADSVRFSEAFIKNLGSEPKVIGASFDKNNQAKVSAPIEGTNGVYYVKVNQIGALPNAMANTDQQRKALETQLRQYATFSTMEALRKAADVKDTRRDAGY